MQMTEPTPPPAGPAPTAEDVFALLEHLLGGSKIRVDAKARPIYFELLPSREVWRFDPRAPGALFAPGDLKDAAPGELVLHCEPELLVRLVKSQGFELRDEDTAWFDGPIDDLLPLASALEAGSSLLGIRARKGKS